MAYHCPRSYATGETSDGFPTRSGVRAQLSERRPVLRRRKKPHEGSMRAQDNALRKSMHDCCCHVTFWVTSPIVYHATSIMGPDRVRACVARFLHARPPTPSSVLDSRLSSSHPASTARSLALSVRAWAYSASGNRAYSIGQSYRRSASRDRGGLCEPLAGAKQQRLRMRQVACVGYNLCWEHREGCVCVTSSERNKLPCALDTVTVWSSATPSRPSPRRPSRSSIGTSARRPQAAVDCPDRWCPLSDPSR